MVFIIHCVLIISLVCGGELHKLGISVQLIEIWEKIKVLTPFAQHLCYSWITHTSYKMSQKEENNPFPLYCLSPYRYFWCMHSAYMKAFDETKFNYSIICFLASCLTLDLFRMIFHFVNLQILTLY
jgi:hypothetical protein